MGAKEYYYSEENKINPRHDLPEGVIVLKEEELFELMENFKNKECETLIDFLDVNSALWEQWSRGKISSKDVLHAYLNDIYDTTGDT